jgi:hypothetical protein
MPSVSKKQQKFMGIVRSIQKGEQPAGKFSKAAQDAAKKMKKSSVKKYAKTKHDDLPVKKESLSKSQIKKMRDEFDKTGELPPHLKKIAKGKKEFEKKFKVKDIEIPGLEWMSKLGEERDYKAEYKKFQSSTKAKKYRAELNKYNRQKGTYGNGDGKDASHKGGKIVGFEKESTNRGRAEKSRLKKENIRQEIEEYVDGILDGMGEEFMVNEEQCMCEACQKGYMTHPTRKTKEMFGKRYRNCIKKEDVNEAVYKLKRGSTNKDLDELDALLSRAGYKGTPDFNKMTWTTKDKNPKILKIIKSKGGKKIKESVDEAVSPKGWNMSKKFITILGREVKNLQKYHRQQNEEDFLEVANYMELQLKYMKKNLKESVDDWTVNIKLKEGTCGYGIDGKIGEEPAGPNLMKKIKKISKDKEKKKILKSKKEGVNEAGKVTYKLKGFTNTKMDELDAELSRLGIKGTPDFNKMTYTIHMKGSNTHMLDKLMKKKGGKKIKEAVIKVSKKDDVPGNVMKMSGEEKIKKLVYSGSNGKGSYEIKGKNLNVNGIRPRDKGFFVRHFTMKTGFRKANLYYDGVNFMDKNKKF